MCQEELAAESLKWCLASQHDTHQCFWPKGGQRGVQKGETMGPKGGHLWKPRPKLPARVGEAVCRTSFNLCCYFFVYRHSNDKLAEWGVCYSMCPSCVDGEQQEHG